MKLVITGTQGAGKVPPSVGIFWRVQDVLLVERSSLPQAEEYGECLTHSGGHYERWQEWQSRGAPWLTKSGFPPEIASTEYDDWPRGRVVYETVPKRFVIYADRRLQTPEIIDHLKNAFGLAAENAIVKSDAHYR